jgi:uncharacterized protein
MSQPSGARISATARLRWECAAVFVLIPLLLAIFKLKGVLFSALWLSALCGFIWLRNHTDYTALRDWNVRGMNRPWLNVMLLRYLLLTCGLLGFTWLMVPEHFFAFPKERPAMWAMVMLLYPLLSVLPQEFLYRSFFLRRYQAIMSPAALALLSALLFGWVHIVLHNWVAVVFSAIGGVMFTRSYQQTQSLAAAVLEHALYGCTIFTVGLGVFFYHGFVK